MGGMPDCLTLSDYQQLRQLIELTFVNITLITSYSRQGSHQIFSSSRT